MAETKTTAKKTTTRKKTTVKKTETAVTETPVVDKETEIKQQSDTTEVNVKSKKKLVLSNDILLNVESTTFGRLIYVNNHTGDKVVWENEGEIQQISVENIREMKSRQPSFFKDYLIRIISVEEPGYEDYTAEEIYKALTLQQYYANSMLDVEDLILNQTDKISDYIEKMGKSFKTSLIIKCNDMIKDGTLDSFSTIIQLQKILNTDLMDEK